jgi:hypothetical protein
VYRLEPEVAKYCNNCGGKNPNAAKFCSVCGSALSEHFDAFLSHRNNPAGPAALLIQQRLHEWGGKNVFVDKGGLKSGRYPNQLLRRIEQSDYLILLLTKGALDRCTDPDDWLAREICHAVRLGKDIIPVLDDFEFPESMDTFPQEMHDLHEYQAVPYNTALLYGTIMEIVRLMGGPSSPPPEPEPSPEPGPGPGPGPGPYPPSETSSPQWIGIALLALGLIVGVAAWFIAPTLATGQIPVGDLSKAIVARVTQAAAGSDAAWLATDAVLRDEAGHAVLEVTRMRTTQASGGIFGAHWDALLPYAVERGQETTQVANARVPTTVTLTNRLNEKKTKLDLQTQGRYGYGGPGLAPWKQLSLLSDFGLLLTDDAGSEVEFSHDDRVLSLRLAGARWVYHYQDDKLVLVESIPESVKLGSLGNAGVEEATVVDALDSASFKLSEVGPSEGKFNPVRSERWKTLMIDRDGSGARLTDRFDFVYSFRPLDEMTGVISQSLETPPDHTETGLRFHYDPRGRVARVAVGNEGEVTYEYDEGGGLAVVTDMAGVRRAYFGSDGDVVALSKLNTIRLWGGLGGGTLCAAGVALMLLGRRRRGAQ